MLLPKRMKYRKQHRGRMAGIATRGNYIDFGDYGIMANECGWITNRQIEAARIAMTRSIRRGGKVWIRVFPDKPITKKPLEQRMGKGKAPVEGWVAVVKPGRIMFEMDGVPEDVAREALRLAMMKLPIDCKFVTKKDFENGPPMEQGREHTVAKAKAKYEEDWKNPKSYAQAKGKAAKASTDEPVAAGDASEETATTENAE
ncbi:MAG: 50S ribosomal protein L16 [Armatimonadetes bacterium]|nr:50S ribosomal protein L16 [Armatimonadota bacterium]